MPPVRVERDREVRELLGEARAQVNIYATAQANGQATIGEVMEKLQRRWWVVEKDITATYATTPPQAKDWPLFLRSQIADNDRAVLLRAVYKPTLQAIAAKADLKLRFAAATKALGSSSPEEFILDIGTAVAVSASALKSLRALSGLPGGNAAMIMTEIRAAMLQRHGDRVLPPSPTHGDVKAAEKAIKDSLAARENSSSNSNNNNNNNNKRARSASPESSRRRRRTGSFSVPEEEEEGNLELELHTEESSGFLPVENGRGANTSVGGSRTSLLQSLAGSVPAEINEDGEDEGQRRRAHWVGLLNEIRAAPALLPGEDGSVLASGVGALRSMAVHLETLFGVVDIARVVEEE